MSNYTEVEKKFKLECSLKQASEFMAEIGARKIHESKQIDTYYGPRHRDFLEEDVITEWLRLRTEDASISINYKRWLPLGAPVRTHCDEFESTVSDGDAMMRILDALDFEKLVTVCKKRHTWSLRDTVEIAIDKVDNLGTFIEFEYKGDESVEGALNEIDRVIREIPFEMGPQDRRGYPYQLLAKAGRL